MSIDIFESSSSHVSTMHWLKSISYGNSSVGHTSKPSTPYGHQLDGNEIVNAPLSCYIVKRKNRKVAIAGLVQLSNLTSSYNWNKKVAITGRHPLFPTLKLFWDLGHSPMLPATPLSKTIYEIITTHTLHICTPKNRHETS